MNEFNRFDIILHVCILIPGHFFV